MSQQDASDNPEQRGGNASFTVRMLFSGAGTVITMQPHYGHARLIQIDSGMQSMSMVLDGAQLRQLCTVAVQAFAEIRGFQETRAMLTVLRDETQTATFSGRVPK